MEVEIILLYFAQHSTENTMENIKQLAKSNWPGMVIALPAIFATIYGIITSL